MAWAGSGLPRLGPELGARKRRAGPGEREGPGAGPGLRASQGGAGYAA